MHYFTRKLGLVSDILWAIVETEWGKISGV